jgi:uncharacterized OB-fold protein
LTQGRLLYQKCGHCGTAFAAGRLCCEICWSDDLSWQQASGKGTLYSFVVYHRQFHPDHPVPYNVAVVELAEGLRIPASVLAAPDRLRVGMSLHAHIADGIVRFDAEPDDATEQ